MVAAQKSRNLLALVLLSALASTSRADVIMDWNARADSIATDKRLLPPVHGRVLAIMHVAMFEAVNAIERRYVSAEGFAKMICDQFDVLYKEGAKSGRVMAIALHPYLIGVPHRIGAFDAALKYICKHKKVWKATGSEIASHYLAQMDGRKTPAQKRAGGRR